MIATIIGGFFFLGSQAWEWSHFIHGSEFGKVELSDGSQAIVKGHFGEIESFTVVEPGNHHKKNEKITTDLMHTFQHAVENGDFDEKKRIRLHVPPFCRMNTESARKQFGVIAGAGSGTISSEAPWLAHCK